MKKSDMKIVFAGTPDLAAYILEQVVNAGYDVIEVITNPDRPRGRKKIPVPSDVKAKAVELGIPVHTTAKIRLPEEVEHIRALAPDMMIVAAFGQIIPKEILEIPRYGCVNVHASLLPAYRGAAPIQWAVLKGEKETGVTIMQMNEGLDTGDMLSQSKVEISDDETAGSLFEKVQEASASLLIETLPKIERGDINPIPQPEVSTTMYAKMISKDMGHIDWTKTADEIDRIVRGMNPWPSAFTYLEGRQVKIWKAKVPACGASENEEGPKDLALCRSNMTPGSIKVADGDIIFVRTGDGWLRVDELQLEGKKRMGAAEFLRGRNLEGKTFESKPDNVNK